MLHLIPAVKQLQLTGGCLARPALQYNPAGLDPRLAAALQLLPCAPDGVPLALTVGAGAGEAYTLAVQADGVQITAESPAGAFYAIQTLRQLFAQGEVPCLQIADRPDFAYRGFYHDVTRGKINALESLKQLIDRMAYYKLNSLQLYVEHTFAFEQARGLHPATGCLTADELRELDAYCAERFIDFVPSLATFGHMYEILQQPQYQHLRVLKGYQPSPNFWHERMRHHTIDPQQPESMQLVGSLIDQYMQHFSSQWFNICGDETFDLKMTAGAATGQIYVDFVQKIIAHVVGKGKKVMMWADILLQHPETIDLLPANTLFLNWDYEPTPREQSVATLAALNRRQVVCPGTSSWSRLCEDVDAEEQNIANMAAYGMKYGAVGLLNTNWGDWGNPCSLELAMYGMVLGAQKSWAAAAPIDTAFYNAVDTLLYRMPGAMACLKAVSRMHTRVDWNTFVRDYIAARYQTGDALHPVSPEALAEVQSGYRALADQLAGAQWPEDEYRRELLLAAEGVCVLAELSALHGQPDVQRITDTAAWAARYRAQWLAKNKPSEVDRLIEMFLYCQQAAEQAAG